MRCVCLGSARILEANLMSLTRSKVATQRRFAGGTPSSSQRRGGGGSTASVTPSRVLHRIILPHAGPSSASAATVRERKDDREPGGAVGPAVSLSSFPSMSSLRSGGLIKSVYAASPRDLDILVRRCCAAATSTSSHTKPLAAPHAHLTHWEEAVLLLQGALHLSMVPTRQTYRSVLELVAVHCSDLAAIRCILENMSGGSQRSSVSLRRYLLRYLARHQPHHGLDFLVEHAEKHKGEELDVPAVAEIFERIVASDHTTVPAASPPATWAKMLSLLPFLDAHRCPPNTQMVQALLHACSCSSGGKLWNVAMSLMASVTSQQQKNVAATSTAPASLVMMTAPMVVSFLKAVTGTTRAHDEGQNDSITPHDDGAHRWSIAIQFVVQHAGRDILRNAHVQMALAVCLVQGRGKARVDPRSTLVAGGVGGKWLDALAMADSVLMLHPDYAGDDRWEVHRHALPLLPSWKSALEYLRRSAIGTTLDERNVEGSGDLGPMLHMTSAAVTHWTACRAALVHRIPSSSVVARQQILQWMRSHPSIAAARLNADAASPQLAHSTAAMGALWADALAAASTSLASVAPTRDDVTEQHVITERLLVAAVRYELVRTQLPVDELATLGGVTVNGNQRHALQHFSVASFKELLRLVARTPTSSATPFWRGALRLLTASSQAPPPTAVPLLAELVRWQAEVCTDWESALSICAHIPCTALMSTSTADDHHCAPTTLRHDALEKLMEGQNLWQQGLQYALVCDGTSPFYMTTESEQNPACAPDSVARTFGVRLCAAAGKLDVVRSVLRLMGTTSDADRFLLDGAELHHEEALVRNAFQNSLFGSRKVLPRVPPQQQPTTSARSGEEWPFLVHARRNPVVPLSLALIAASGWSLVLDHIARRRTTGDVGASPSSLAHNLLLDQLQLLLSFASVRFPAVAARSWPHSLKALHAWVWGATTHLQVHPLVPTQQEPSTSSPTVVLHRLRERIHVEVPHLVMMPSSGGDHRDDVDWILAATISGMWSREAEVPTAHNALCWSTSTALCAVLETLDTGNPNTLPAANEVVSAEGGIDGAAVEPLAEDVSFAMTTHTIRTTIMRQLDRTLCSLMTNDGMKCAVHSTGVVDALLHWGLKQERRDNHSPSDALLRLGTCVDNALVTRTQWECSDDQEANPDNAPPQRAVIGVAAVEYLVGDCGCTPPAASLERIAMSLLEMEAKCSQGRRARQQGEILQDKGQWGSVWQRLMRTACDTRVLATAAPFQVLMTGAERCARHGDWAGALRLVRKSTSVAPEERMGTTFRFLQQAQQCLNDNSTVIVASHSVSQTTEGVDTVGPNELLAECVSGGPHRWHAALALMTAVRSPQSAAASPHVTYSGALLRCIAIDCASATRDARVILKVMHVLHHQQGFAPQRDDLTAMMEGAFSVSRAVASGRLDADSALQHAAILMVAMLRRYFSTEAPGHQAIAVLLDLCPWASAVGLQRALATLAELRDVLHGSHLVDAMTTMLQLRDQQPRNPSDDDPTASAPVVHTDLDEAAAASSRWIAQGIAESQDPRRVSAESVMDASLGYWTTQRLRIVAQYVPELLAAESATDLSPRERLKAVAETVVTTALKGSVPAEAVLTAWDTPSLRERLMRSHYSTIDGEDAKRALGEVKSKVSAPRTYGSTGGGTDAPSKAQAQAQSTADIPNDVLTFAALYGPWIRYGATSLVNKRAVAVLGHEVAEQWPVHRLRTVLNVHRKLVARRFVQHRRTAGPAASTTGAAQPSPWYDEECVEDLLTSIPFLVRVLPFVLSMEEAQDSSSTAAATSDDHRELQEAVCSSVLHNLIPVRVLETLWPTLTLHAQVLQDRRWPREVEAELVTAVTLRPGSEGVCPSTLASRPSASRDDIRQYWALLHPILAPGAAFHALELRHVAEHYYPALRAAASSTSTEGGAAALVEAVCRDIAFTVFPLQPRQDDPATISRHQSTFGYHSPLDVQQLWRKSSTAMHDMWRTSPSFVPVDPPTVSQGIVEDCSAPSQPQEAQGGHHHHPSRQRNRGDRIHTAAATAAVVAPAPMSAAVAVRTTPVQSTTTAAPPAPALPHTRTQFSSARSLPRNGLRWRVALSLLKWSLSTMSSSSATSHDASKLVQGLLPVVQLCLMDGGTSIDVARGHVEGSIGPVDDDTWDAVCRHSSIVAVLNVGRGGADGGHRCVESATHDDVLAPFAEMFPSVLLASLRRVVVQLSPNNDEIRGAVAPESLLQAQQNVLQLLSSVALTTQQQVALRQIVEEHWPPRSLQAGDRGDDVRTHVLTLLWSLSADSNAKY